MALPGDLEYLPGLDLITSYLLAVKESLAALEITPGMLIVEDLGLDSMDLTELAVRIRADLGAIDLMPWLAQATAGEGTVASLAEFVAAACPGALAERRRSDDICRYPDGGSRRRPAPSRPWRRSRRR